MGEIAKRSFIALPGAGGCSGLMPSGLWVPPGGVARSFLGFKEQGVVSVWTVLRLAVIKVKF